MALAIGATVTIALTLTAHALYAHNERRLLQARVKEAEQLLGAVQPSVQTPLASAAALADATNGNRKKFRAFIRPYVGSGAGRPFISVSLWRLNAAGRGPKVVLGARPEATPLIARTFLARAKMTSQLSVLPMLGLPIPRVGYALTSHGRASYAAYGESAVPAHRFSASPPNSAFSDVNYALYLGAEQAQNLIVTNVARLPIAGRQASGRVPFGTTYFTLVISPRRPLGGALPQRLPWIILAAGLVLTLGAALLMTRLVQGREAARRMAVRLEHIAAENRRLYGEQRDIAQTLQHSLLPEELPTLAGAEISARYLAGEQGVEIGGDWYDVIRLDDARVLMVVGDVSGRGLRAATTMAQLRHAIHAYAAENNSPAPILSKLSKLMSVAEQGKLATVMCAVVDLPQHRVTLASAGHLPPLLIGRYGESEFLTAPIGPPIGLERGTSYKSRSFQASAGSTMLGFTDGLVERRGESLDDGLARLRDAAASNHLPLPELLESLLTQLRAHPTEDDTAIIGIRWRA